MDQELSGRWDTHLLLNPLFRDFYLFPAPDLDAYYIPYHKSDKKVICIPSSVSGVGASGSRDGMGIASCAIICGLIHQSEVASTLLMPLIFILASHSL